jgi:hypothetical protein
MLWESGSPAVGSVFPTAMPAQFRKANTIPDGTKKMNLTSEIMTKLILG